MSIAGYSPPMMGYTYAKSSDDGGGGSGSKTTADDASSSKASAAASTSTAATSTGRDPDLIKAGETLKLADGSSYVVKQGDTLSGIAKQTGASLDSLMAANGMNEGLLGKNAAGQYFDSSAAGPVPSPGSVQQGAPQDLATATAEQKKTSSSTENKAVSSTMPGPDDADVTKKKSVITDAPVTERPSV